MDTSVFSEIAASYTGNEFPSPGSPTKVAQVILGRGNRFGRHVVTFQNVMYVWNGSCYASVKDSYIDSILTQDLVDATWMKPPQSANGSPTQTAWAPDKRKKSLVIHEMKALTLVDDTTPQGGYIGSPVSRVVEATLNSGSEQGEHTPLSPLSPLLSYEVKNVVVPSLFHYIGKRRLKTAQDAVKEGLTSDDGVCSDSGLTTQADYSNWAGSFRRLDWYAWQSDPSFFFTYNVDATVLDEGESEGWVHELPCPNWHAFLKSVWPDEPDSISLLQEIFGYLLSGRTDLQKAFMIVGKKRSGKGTIARVLTQLLGSSNIASPSLRGLADDGQKASLIGKTLAVVADAGNAGRAAGDLAETIKTITGEDMVTIPRKYMNAWEGKLPTRFLIMSNAVPRFNDESGAVASRFAILHTAISHEGHEDTDLLGKLLSELAGILTWSLEGLDRLNANGGHFTEPDSARMTKAALRSMSNPKIIFASEFIRPCETGEVPAAEIFDSWRKWCEQHNERPGPAAHFGAWLAEEYGVRTIRPRVNGRQVRVYTGIELSEDAPRPAMDITTTNWEK